MEENQPINCKICEKEIELNMLLRILDIIKKYFVCAECFVKKFNELLSAPSVNGDITKKPEGFSDEALPF